MKDILLPTKKDVDSLQLDRQIADVCRNQWIGLFDFQNVQNVREKVRMKVTREETLEIIKNLLCLLSNIILNNVIMGKVTIKVRISIQYKYNKCNK